jgi:hypothetical protein
MITRLTEGYNPYSNSNSNSFRTSVTVTESKQIISSVKDLINPDYESWYYARLKQVGKTKFIEAAEHARKYGKDKSKLFAYLLK